jgi:hypothetical protein
MTGSFETPAVLVIDAGDIYVRASSGTFCPQRPTSRCSCSGYRAPCTVIREAALSISLRSSEVSLIAAAPMFSSSRASFVVPGIGTIQDFWASSHASAI